MGLIEKEVFVCLDCETTGLDPKEDRIIEIAAVQFTFSTVQSEFESLVDPERPISEASIAIHHITDDMVQGKPKIEDVLPELLRLVGRYPIVGHGIGFDIDIIAQSCERAKIPCNIKNNPSVDTLRMARLYGESPVNSLEQLRQHFNIEPQGAHRAMNDVVVNIEVFKYLSTKFKTLKQLQERLQSPIALRAMPLGKHKGRPFKEIPYEYLMWASRQNFDQDLLFSLRQELKKRKKGNLFSQSANPFSEL
ncbi:MAG: dnaQ3 [Chlamydiales bacterium]|jgi:DNA polymerase-3 subunit epsilon|nr:dnaQ3 [Chlamydiales bacterium]